MPYATPYSPAYTFYYGHESTLGDPETIYESYPGLQFTIGEGDAAYNIDPTSIEQRPARRDLLDRAQQLAWGSGDIVPLPADLPYDDAVYTRDLAMFLKRSGAGIPVAGGRYGDNAGDGWSLGSLLSNEFVTAGLALGAATGLAGAFGGFAAAPGAVAASGAGAETLASALPAELGSVALATGEGTALGAPAAGIAPIAATPATVAPVGATFTPSTGLAAISNTVIPGTSLTVGQVTQALSAANSLYSLSQDPSGANVGTVLGGLLGSATGIAGLGTLGSLTGRTVGGAIDQPGSPGSSSTGGTGGGTVGEVNWAQLLPALIALAGTTGLGLYSGIQGQGSAEEIAGQQGQAYQQQQALYQQLLALAQLYNTQLQGYNERVVHTDVLQNQETDAARAARQAIGGRLADPAQVLAGANALYQPLTDATMADISRAVQHDLAMRGQSDGGAANRATAEAFARLIPQLRQQSIQNYVTSQQNALQGYTGPYTANPTPPSYAGGNFPSAPGVSAVPKYNPYGEGLSGDTLKNLGSQLGNIVTLLGLANTQPGWQQWARSFDFGQGLNTQNLPYDFGDTSSLFTTPTFDLETYNIPYDFGF